MTHALSKIWLVVIPPLAFLVFDLLATTVLLFLAEPGITPRAALYYHIALLPGTLLVSADGAVFINMLFGLLIGCVLFLGITWRNFRTRRSMDL